MCVCTHVPLFVRVFSCVCVSLCVSPQVSTKTVAQCVEFYYTYKKHVKMGRNGALLYGEAEPPETRTTDEELDHKVSWGHDPTLLGSRPHPPGVKTPPSWGHDPLLSLRCCALVHPAKSPTECTHAPTPAHTHTHTYVRSYSHEIGRAHV